MGSFFSETQLKRYSRNITLDEVGIQGQQLFQNSKVLIIGAGGLGSPILMYLAACGVGTIGIADGDTVDYSNLNRQIIHRTESIGINKVSSAKKALQDINPDVTINTYETMVVPDNIGKIIKEYDIVVDATDNFDAKFLINDTCVLEEKPYIHAGVIGFEGQVMTILPKQTACYRCLYSSPPSNKEIPTPSEVGILGVIPGVIGAIQATEVIKIILKKGNLLTDRLLFYNALKMNFAVLDVKKKSNCQICGNT